MIKVLYVITSPAHKRAIEPFCKYDGLDQLIAAPSGIDVSDFSLKVETYSDRASLQNIVDSFVPDIYAQSSLPCPGNINIPSACKRVYISHGLVGSHVKGIIKTAGFDTSVWKGCDLYCGAWDSVFSEWIQHTAGVSKDKILPNALPQLDILHGGVDIYRAGRLARDFDKKYANDKVVLFFGFCCKDRVDFIKHNQDYFETVVKLKDMVNIKGRNFLLYVKPRQEKKKLIGYFHRHNLPKLRQAYQATYNKSRIHYIGSRPNHVLDYYFADVFIINGCSTAEIEACALKKPLFVVRTRQNSKHGYDPYGTVSSGAATEVTSMDELEIKINEYFESGKHHNPDKQEKLLKNMGITFDGMAYKRIQKKLVTL